MAGIGERRGYQAGPDELIGLAPEAVGVAGGKSGVGIFKRYMICDIKIPIPNLRMSIRL